MITSVQKLLMARAGVPTGVPTGGPEWDVTLMGGSSAYLNPDVWKRSQDLSFSDDGTVLVNSGIFFDVGRIYAETWSLSTAWDVSTASTLASSDFTGLSSSTIRAVTFGDNGSKLFWGDDGGSVGSLTATTPYDLTTFADDSNGTSLTGFSSINGIHWANSTTFYLTCADTTLNDWVAQKFTCSSAWDVTTASASGSYKQLNQSGLNAPRGMFVDSTETHLFVVDQNSLVVFRYDMSSSGDLSTAAYVSQSGPYGGSAVGVRFKPDGLSVYVLNDSGGGVFQYNLS